MWRQTNNRIIITYLSAIIRQAGTDTSFYATNVCYIFTQNQKSGTVKHLLSKYLSCSICFDRKVCSAVGSGRLLLDPFISQFSIAVVSADQLQSYDSTLLAPQPAQ